MKLKYYLRGLGIGIVVTALLMGIAARDNGQLSDAQIKQRAEALGMVEAGSLKLSDLQETEKPEGMSEAEATEEESVSQETSEAENTDADETKDSDDTVPANAETADSASTEGTDNTVADNMEATGGIGTEDFEEDSTEDAVAEKKTITVKRGDSSDSVARALEKAGLIEDAKAFDRYLCDNGYATRISVGTYEIEMGASEEEIAKIITGKK